MAKVSQLRLYTIEEGKLDDFVREWLHGVYPLRKKRGFTIDNAWLIRDESKFAWILSYDGPDGFAERDAAYYASPERVWLDPDPARLLVQSQDWFISSVLPE